MRNTTNSTQEQDTEGHAQSLPSAISIWAGPERTGGILARRSMHKSEEEANLPGVKI